MTKEPAARRSRIGVVIGVWIMAALLALYIGFALHRVWVLVTTGQALGAAMGAALLVISLIAVWALWRELWFGVQANRLTRQLEAEDALPDDDGLEARWNGMPARAAALGVLPRYEQAAAEDPEKWQNWQRLGIMRRAAGQNGEARAAIREAIRREKTNR